MPAGRKFILVLIMLWLPLQGAIAAIMPLCVQAKEIGASLDIPAVTAACDLHHEGDGDKAAASSAADDATFSLPCESAHCFTSFSILLPSAYAAPILASNSSYALSFNSRFTSSILQHPQRPPLA
jgi:hypothetical protein